MVRGIFRPYPRYCILKSPAAKMPQTRSQTMKIRHFLAALPLVLSLAMSAAAQARTSESHVQRQGYGVEGREVAAPSWSDACTSDQGPSRCGEPMWVYGSPGAIARYKSAF
jgi:hypothetical protein